jgi:hypothetical protein
MAKMWKRKSQGHVPLSPSRHALGDLRSPMRWVLPPPRRAPGWRPSLWHVSLWGTHLRPSLIAVCHFVSQIWIFHLSKLRGRSNWIFPQSKANKSRGSILRAPEFESWLHQVQLTGLSNWTAFPYPGLLSSQVCSSNWVGWWCAVLSAGLLWTLSEYYPSSPSLMLLMLSLWLA